MGASLDQRAPCARCPWRKDADPSYWDPEEFFRMTRSLRERHGLMLCHKSPGVRILPPGERSPLSGTLPRPALCAGYVLVDGFRSNGLRLWSMINGVDPTTECSAEGVALHESWEDVLLALVDGRRDAKLDP